MTAQFSVELLLELDLAWLLTNNPDQRGDDGNGRDVAFVVVLDRKQLHRSDLQRRIARLEPDDRLGVHR